MIASAEKISVATIVATTYFQERFTMIHRRYKSPLKCEPTKGFFNAMSLDGSDQQ
jgi:hypothetical protein